MSSNKAIMSVSLTKDLKDYVKKRTKSAHYGTRSDYVRSLIRDDMHYAEQEQLEKELLKGMNSGKRIHMTPKQWEKLRGEIYSRINRPQK